MVPEPALARSLLFQPSPRVNLCDDFVGPPRPPCLITWVVSAWIEPHVEGLND
jgi:hypothetical protein